MERNGGKEEHRSLDNSFQLIRAGASSPCSGLPGHQKHYGKEETELKRAPMTRLKNENKKEGEGKEGTNQG